jgi:hypothetical protein
MGQFKNFLKEEEDEYLTDAEVLQLINDELADMDEDEIFAFAEVLYYEFFDDEENPDDNYHDFDINDVNAMIAALGPEFYADILDMLLPEDEKSDFEWDEIELGDEEEEGDDTNEAVSRVMKRRNFNRKKRKFFTKTKAQLRKGVAQRRKLNRKNRAKKKRFYRANKKRLQQYKKSRSAAMKKGRHIKKVRRGA